LTNTDVPAAIKVVSGSGQSTPIDGFYGKRLVVKVTDSSGHPVSGITVVFELPGPGASGTFVGGSAAAVTSSNGVATSPALRANAVRGNFTVNAWVAGVSHPAAFKLTIVPPQGRAARSEQARVDSGQVHDAQHDQQQHTLEVLPANVFGNLVGQPFQADANGGTGHGGSRMGRSVIVAVAVAVRVPSPAVKVKLSPPRNTGGEV